MGKGFNNYMCKKFFHPASRDNLKRVWMAEQQTESYKKKQEELRLQYEKEQDLYTNKAIMSKESKEKLSVNFLYEPPPGTKKDREREDDEPEFKFEWQRRFNAPRESYCKGDQEIRDQPFGIQVRNVRCIKCHKWGHINTDKECPMYNQSAGGTEGGSNLNPSELIRQMREDGLAMKKGAVGLLELPSSTSHVNNHQLIPSSSEDEDHMNESELKFLEGLSTKKKLKLLRKLEKMEKKKKKKKKHKKEKKETIRDGTDSDNSDSDSPSSKKKVKNAVKTGSDWMQRVPEDSQSQHSRPHTINKEVENDLYAVLGRKMDFEGPPQNQSRAGTGTIPKRGRRSRSGSNGRGRSRSPIKDRKRYHHNNRADAEKSVDSRRNRRHSQSPEDRGRVKNRSVSPGELRKNNEKAPRRRDRSSSRDKHRRSRSRSREPLKRSRSPIHKDSSRNSSGYRHR